MTARIRDYLKKRRESGQDQEPVLVVDLDVVRTNYQNFAKALPDTRVFYAVKANPAPEVLALLAKLGSCFDTASVPEIEMVLAAGATADRISYGNLAVQVAAMRKEGREIVIVSSGAIAAGRRDLGLLDRPRTIPQKQAAAAIGQTRLMRAYEDAFALHGLRTAQILLTRSDLADRTRFLNARATLETLLECGAVPVINENDTVVVDEIKFGDNDNLSALVTNLVDAQLARDPHRHRRLSTTPIRGRIRMPGWCRW